ncbi:MAG: hypothetical protein B6D82_13455 [gamma proteobacterium symbiont of Ctena orbiculata]|nr:MAG: hypothetical protein DBP00_00670 [gamma proteobacterium symbiont of Ctena orbiculata]PVV09920.1 MAG: hypothetical protein B6D82_13455 [gamma proteobacterium symbiont of Ctena orbiculata]
MENQIFLQPYARGFVLFILSLLFARKQNLQADHTVKKENHKTSDLLTYHKLFMFNSLILKGRHSLCLYTVNKVPRRAIKG